MTARGKQTLHEVYMLLQHCPPPPTPSFKTRVCLTPVRSEDVGTVYKVTTRGKLRLIFSAWGGGQSRPTRFQRTSENRFFFFQDRLCCQRQPVVSSFQVRKLEEPRQPCGWLCVSVSPSRSAVCLQPRSVTLLLSCFCIESHQVVFTTSASLKLLACD